MAIISMPAMVFAADMKILKPSIGLVLCLEATLKAAFLVARAKFGEDFVIKGPTEFVQQVGAVIVKTSGKDLEREGQTGEKGLTR